MPRVIPHYGSSNSNLFFFSFRKNSSFFFLAVKCNDDVNVIKLLAYLGAGFDCASKGEIKKVMDLGVSRKIAHSFYFLRIIRIVL